MNIVTSNRMEYLFARLVQLLEEPLPSPMDREWFVVSGRGMQRWLNLQLAEHFGVWANTEFYTPLEAMQSLFAELQEESEPGKAFDPQVMTWSLFRLLEQKQGNEFFEPILPYLEEENPELKLYYLASRLAESFDRYTIYRPTLLDEWESGLEPNDWQATLWRELNEETESRHRVAQRKKAMEKLTFSADECAGLPKRLFVFGISRLPPFFTDFFQALSQVVPVHLFVLNPCKEYWGDVIGEKERISRTLRTGKGLTAEELYLEVGNSLLASMGRHSQEFLDMLLEYGQFEDEFIEPPTERLLGQIQSDILNLNDRAVDAEEPLKHIQPEDDSVQIHVCHSPMRELEVLYDQLLRRFDSDPTLSPRDVLVMAPDISVYVPLIQSVFQPSDVEEGAVSIPFSIAEQRKRVEQEVCEAFLSLLQFTSSRYGLVQVLELLEVEAIHRRFGMTEEDVMQVRHWLEDVRIRWGRDEQHRAELGMPRIRENTWMAGLDRLLLGFAMPGEDIHLFDGILPYDPIEGESTLLLGRLVEFIQSLFGYTRACEESRTLVEWSDFLLSLVDTFFHENDDTERSLQFLRERLHELRESAELASFERSVEMPVILAWLESSLSDTRNPAAFLTGAVTFANLLPLRGIPARIVCVLGLNDTDFPRQETLPGFDRVRQKAMLGDHSERHDDRYKFLEALLSARETFLLSYLGQDIHDNSSIAPSVVVSELRDYLRKNYVALDEYGMMTGDPIRQVEYRHPLHPFNPTYFSEGSRFFSYSRANYRAAQVLREQRWSSRPLLPSPLPDPAKEYRVVALSSLVSFFRHPVKYFLRERLGLQLEGEPRVSEEKENFTLDGLQKYKLNQLLLEQGLKGLPLEQSFAVAQATGAWPHGRVGESMYASAVREVRGFLEKLSKVHPQEPSQITEVDLTIKDFHLVGYLRDIWAPHRLQYRYSNLKANDRLEAWLTHLIMNGLNRPDVPVKTMVLSKDKQMQIEPVGMATMLLEQLLNYYWRGLQKPLPLFPKTSLSFVMELSGKKKKSQEEALDSARKKGWVAEFGDAADQWNRLAFGEDDPLLDPVFQSIALDIFGPLLKFQKEIR